MSHWTQWARDALDNLTPAHEESDPHLRAALEDTARTGREPYFTLIAAVVRLGLLEDDEWKD